MFEHIPSMLILILLANILIWGIVLGFIFYAKRHNGEGSCRFYKHKGFRWKGSTINIHGQCNDYSSSDNDSSSDNSSSDRDSY